MTTKVFSIDPNLFVESQNSFWIGGDSSNPVSGTVRWNTTNQCMQIYTGSVWQDYVQNYNVGLTHTVREIVEWARKKMQEEELLKEKIKQHPGLKDAYEKFRLTEILVTEEADHE